MDNQTCHAALMLRCSGGGDGGGLKRAITDVGSSAAGNAEAEGERYGYGVNHRAGVEQESDSIEVINAAACAQNTSLAVFASDAACQIRVSLLELQQKNLSMS